MRRAPIRSKSAGRWSLGGLLFLSALCLTLHVAAARKLSPIDEFQHIDYLARASKVGIVRTGDLVGDLAMRAEACRGIEYPSQYLPPCSSEKFNPRDFQEFGTNTAAGDPPLYYLSTGLVARAITAVTPLDLVDAARMVGTIWIGGALVLLWFLFTEFNVGLWQRVTASILLVIAPVTLNSGATVTSDAVLLAAGAAVLLTTVRWVRGAQAAWVPMFLAALGVFGKFTAVVGAAVAAGYLCIVGLQASSSRSPRLRRRAFALAGGLLVTAATAVGVWVAITAVTARVGADEVDMTRRFHVDALRVDTTISEATTTLPPTKNPRIAGPLYRTPTVAQGVVTDWLLVGALLGSIFFTKGRRAYLGIAALGALLAVGPGLSVAAFVSTHTYIPTPPRYGLAALPALIVLLGGALETRGVLVATGLFAGAGTLWTLLLLARAV